MIPERKAEVYFLIENIERQKTESIHCHHSTRWSIPLTANLILNQISNLYLYQPLKDQALPIKGAFGHLGEKPILVDSSKFDDIERVSEKFIIEENIRQ